MILLTRPESPSEKYYGIWMVISFSRMMENYMFKSIKKRHHGKALVRTSSGITSDVEVAKTRILWEDVRVRSDRALMTRSADLGKMVKEKFNFVVTQKITKSLWFA